MKTLIKFILRFLNENHIGLVIKENLEYIKESIKLYFKPFKSKWIYIIVIPIAVFATYLEIIGVLK